MSRVKKIKTSPPHLHFQGARVYIPATREFEDEGGARFSNVTLQKHQGMVSFTFSLGARFATQNARSFSAARIFAYFSPLFSPSFKLSGWQPVAVSVLTKNSFLSLRRPCTYNTAVRVPSIKAESFFNEILFPNTARWAGVACNYF